MCSAVLMRINLEYACQNYAQVYIRLCLENAHNLGIVQRAELCRNNFEEVLEHILRLGGLFDELRHFFF